MMKPCVIKWLSWDKDWDGGLGTEKSCVAAGTV